MFLKIPTSTAPVDYQAFLDVLIDALVAVGWQVTRSGDGAATISPGRGNFDANTPLSHLVLQRPDGKLAYDLMVGEAVVSDPGLVQGYLPARIKVVMMEADADFETDAGAAQAGTAVGEIVQLGGGTDDAPEFAPLIGDEPGALFMCGLVEDEAPWRFIAWSTDDDIAAWATPGLGPSFAMIHDTVTSPQAEDTLPGIFYSSGIQHGALKLQQMIDSSYGPVGYDHVAGAMTRMPYCYIHGTFSGEDHLYPSQVIADSDERVTAMSIPLMTRASNTPGWKGVSSLIVWSNRFTETVGGLESWDGARMTVGEDVGVYVRIGDVWVANWDNTEMPSSAAAGYSSDTLVGRVFHITTAVGGTEPGGETDPPTFVMVSDGAMQPPLSEARASEVVIDVLDASELRLVTIWLQYDGRVGTFVVYDGNDFLSPFAGSVAPRPGGGGDRITFTDTRGWLAGFRVYARATDASGNLGIE